MDKQVEVSKDQMVIIVEGTTFHAKVSPTMTACQYCEIRKKSGFDAACTNIPCINSERKDTQNVYLVEVNARGKPVKDTN